MPHSSTGAFWGPRVYSKVPGNPECEKELLKLLPELRRIGIKALKDLLSQSEGLRQMAAERSIDMYEDNEDMLPEEIQQYWACHRAQAQMSSLIKYLDACKAQQGTSGAVGWWSASRILRN